MGGVRDIHKQCGFFHLGVNLSPDSSNFITMQTLPRLHCFGKKKKRNMSGHHGCKLRKMGVHTYPINLRSCFACLTTCFQ